MTPSDLDQRLVESRELIKQGDYDRALELLKAAIAQARQQTERLREAYLLMIQTYVILGNYHRSQPHEHAASELDYQEAGARIRECLRTPGLRHTRLGSESEYPAEMVRAFADVRGEIFGSFRVTGLEPQGATVILDGDTLRTQADGKLGDTDLPVGPHNVLIQQPGYQTRNDAIVIAASSTLERSYVLSKPQGRGVSLARGALGLGLIAGFGAAIWGGTGSGGSGQTRVVGQVFEIDPSIRAAGMGGASGAVFWGDDLDDWGNPALLGLGNGLRYQWGTTQLAPGLASDVRFTTHRMLLGFGGIGIGLPGMPGKRGISSLRYATSEGADDNGNPTGDFGGWEGVSSWGAGLSVPRTFETLARLAGYAPPMLSRSFDAAFGFTRKRLQDEFIPTQPFGMTSTDLGFLVRVTPLDDFTRKKSGSKLKLDAAYALSVLNSEGTTVLFDNPPQQYSLRRTFRNSIALHLGAGSTKRRWLPSGDPVPRWSIGLAGDLLREASQTLGASAYEFGLETTFADLLSVRAGRVSTLSGLQGPTFGIGVSYRYRDRVGIRYDWARYPQESGAGLPGLNRNGLSVFVDPLAFTRARARSNAPSSIPAAPDSQ